MKALRLSIKCIAFLLTASCAAPSAWHLDTIATGDPAFDSSRLHYSTNSSHLKLEMLRIGQEISAFVFLKQHRFTPSALDPASVDIALLINGETIRELAPSREGRMRLRLSKPLTERLINALQEGKQVDIVLDGFQEKISPDSFAKRYEELTQERWEFMNFIKGPFG